MVIDPLKTENAVSDNMETGEIKIDSDDEEYVIATRAETDDKVPTNDSSDSVVEGSIRDQGGGIYNVIFQLVLIAQ